jgi:hypothetical protein
MVVDRVRATGLHVSTRKMDAGVTLGVSDALYVYVRPTEAGAGGVEGEAMARWFAGRIGGASTRRSTEVDGGRGMGVPDGMVLVGGTSGGGGIGLGMNRHRVGVSLGAWGMSSVEVNEDEDEVVLLIVDPRAPGEIRAGVYRAWKR